jgi:hypothetical protein
MRRIIKIAPLLLILMTAVYFVAVPDKRLSAAQGTGSVDELVRQSKYVFRGTVRTLGASTISNLPASRDLVVVRVDEVYVAPSTLGDFTGKDITVRIRETPTTSVGQRWVFFTAGWLFAESLAVLEVGRIPFTDDAAGAIRQLIAAAVQRAADQNLNARLTLAELVIVGKVSAVRPATGLPARRPITEHEPDWQEAVITVESTEKGTAQTSVVILFPNSTDEFWIDSPKFKTGQEGIWILQRDQKERGAPSLRIPGLTALNPLDFQNKDQLERIRRLLKGPQ